MTPLEQLIEPGNHLRPLCFIEHIFDSATALRQAIAIKRHYCSTQAVDSSDRIALGIGTGLRLVRST